MERLTRRLYDADSALVRLGEVLAIETPTEVERDAAIKRFEFTFEAVWKAAQRYLAVMEQVEAGSPGAVIRACREAGIGDEDAAEARLEAAKDRNLTSHMYKETVAEAIFARLPGCPDTATRWLHGSRTSPPAQSSGRRFRRESGFVGEGLKPSPTPSGIPVEMPGRGTLHRLKKKHLQDA